MKNSDLWQAVLSELELAISKANFNTWFKNTGISCFQDGQITVCVPNTFSQAWIEKKYHHQIIKSVERVAGQPVKKLNYRVDNIKNIPDADPNTVVKQEAAQTTQSPPPVPATPVKAPQINSGFVLNQKYAFESFVVGKGTELAFAAAKAVVDRPGEAYNPLFIYGGVGLGKTHLLQAIGNELLKKMPGANLTYVSAEKFSNDFISSIRDSTSHDFQNRYRQTDILLIDDIQFIAGKDRTQESFFHTFNELHQRNKQVVITSDRPPKAIPALEDRLKSRFEWGMIVDVAPPDFETRVAILEKKCAEKNFPLDIKILQAVATVAQNNIRELEGALNKIIAYHQLKSVIPTADSVKALLSGLDAASSGRRSLTPQQLVGVVAGFYGVEVDGLSGKSREKKLSFPRQIIMFLLREELKMSYPSIGEELGGRDHSTAMHACEKINSGMENDLKLRQEIDQIRQRLYINNI